MEKKMSKTGIFYGSTTGNTEAAAKKIQSLIGNADLFDISSAAPDDFIQYDNLILGSSTWGYGELQDSWEGILQDLESLDLKGKKMALFGTGDQMSYSDTFVDALGIIEESLSKTGAELIGQWPVEGYDYNASKAEKNGSFVGLALDDDNQSSETDTRINQWVDMIKPLMN
jgi:flavodoxin I